MPPSSTKTLLGAERAERPPHPRRAIEAEAVIEHDRHAVADAERADLVGELLGRRQHVGQGIGLVRDRVDVEALRARNVAGEEFGLGIALGVRQIVRAVEHDHVRIGQMLAAANRSRPASGWRAFRPACSNSEIRRTRSARGGSACPFSRSLSRAPRRSRRCGAHACRRRAAGRARRSRSAAPGRCRSAASPPWS